MRVSHPAPGRLVVEYGQPRVIPPLILVMFLICAGFFTLVGDATFLRSDGTTSQAVTASVWSESVIPLDHFRGASVGEVPGNKGRTDYAVYLTTDERGQVFWLRCATVEDAKAVGQEVEAFAKAHDAGVQSYGDTRWLGWALAVAMGLAGVALALRLTQRVTTIFDRPAGRVTIESSWPWATHRHEVPLDQVAKLRTFTYRGSTRVDLSLKNGAGGYYLGSVAALAAPGVVAAVGEFLPPAA